MTATWMSRLTGVGRDVPSVKQKHFADFCAFQRGALYQMEKQSHCKTRMCRHSIFL